MNKKTLECIVVVGVACFRPNLEAQPVPVFDLRLERSGFPNFDELPIVQGAIGSKVEFTGEMIISTFGMADRGIQGWQMGLKNDGVDILSISDEGAVIRDKTLGGLVDLGFLKYEIVDSHKRNQGQGVVQACVLSFFRPVELPPNTRQVIGRNRYRARIDADRTLASLRYGNDLQGSGQPIQTAVTVAAATARARLRSRSIAIGGGEPFPDENCDDGVDNNADNRADCEDPDCEGADACVAGGGGGYDLVVIAEDAVIEGGEAVTHADPAFKARIPVTIYIVAVGGGAGGGVQGWSLSITHDKDLIGFDPDGGAPTTSGTDAEAFFSGGFRKTEVARDPNAKGNGGGGADDEDGFVSALVLSFTEPQVLPPRGAHSVARARYLLRDGFSAPGVDAARVRFKDGLRGSGQPVTNALTVDGATLKPSHLVPLRIERASLTAPFVRGDANVDHKVNLADAIWAVNELLRHGPRSPCPRASDFNADGLYDLADAMFLIQWMFLSGRTIPKPYPGCGTAPGPEELDCAENAVGYCR